MRRRIDGRHTHQLAHLFKVLPRFWVRLQADWALHQASTLGREPSEALMALQQVSWRRAQEPKFS